KLIMSKTPGNRTPKKIRGGSASPSASTSEANLTATLHVTQVQTTEETEEVFYYYGDPPGQSRTNLQKEEPKEPDLDSLVPRHPPFVAKISNMPMECNEKELRNVFSNFPVVSVTFPKKGKRLKGYALLEVESREEFLRLLALEKKVRGRQLVIKLSDDLGVPVKETVGAGDAPSSQREALSAGSSMTPRTAPTSEPDVVSLHYAASVSNLSSDFRGSLSSLSSVSSAYERSTPLKRKPSSIEELEQRMADSLQKLAEFENAETERFDKSQTDDDPDGYSSCWTEILGEIKKSES
ncbi:hypothetical protein KR018_004412, partial [Drosophila ironensis]